MPEKRRDPSRFDALTGIRAFAAAWVVSFHYILGPFGALGGSHVSKFVDVGYLGVDLFFILSGFVICHVHAGEMAQPSARKFVRFMSLRFARLYPVDLFSLLLLAALVWLGPQWGDADLNPANYTWSHLFLQLALAQGWGFNSEVTWNYPSWSVSAEWFCYLLFPAVALALMRAGARGTWIAILLLLATIAAIYWTAFGASFNQAVGPWSLIRAAPEFALGCALCRLVHNVDMRNWPWAAIVAAFAGLWIASFWTVLPIGLFAIPLFVVLILACSMQRNPVSAWFGARPIVAIGAASYSLYLMQAPVQKAVKVLRPYVSMAHPWRDAAIIAFYLALLAIVTALVHVYVENPSRRILRRKIDAWLGPRREVALVRAEASERRRPLSPAHNSSFRCAPASIDIVSNGYGQQPDDDPVEALKNTPHDGIRVPRLAEPETEIGERQAPRERSDKGVDLEARERHARDPRREGNEGAHDRQQAPDEHRRASEAGEKTVDAVEFGPIEQHIRPPPQDGGSAAVSAEEIGRGGAETAADRAGDRRADHAELARRRQIARERHDDLGRQRNARRFQSHESDHACVARSRNRRHDP
jgi:peptidoglycan/LPS O-acetylase OafA/YrhL